MALYRKKPVEVEAMQITDASSAALAVSWINSNGGRAGMTGMTEGPHGGIGIETLEGTMIAKTGDWVIRGVQGEFFYPCKPDIFEATYEPVEGHS